MYEKSFTERFWNKVDIRGEDECWEWKEYKDPKGYGRITVNGYSRKAHRIAWILIYGDIPNGFNVLHHCDNPPCCNGKHLFLGTNADNTRDMIRKGRDRHPGHPKLIEIQIREIRKSRQEGLTLQEIAQLYSISDQHISDICQRKYWKHIP